MTGEEHKKALKQYHKLSDRHILVAETDMPYSDVLKIVILSDKIRKAGNELVGLMRKTYDQLFRTKRYRKLLSLYGNTGDKAKRKIRADIGTQTIAYTFRITTGLRSMTIQQMFI